jgi:hypothetical protein
VYDPLQGCSLQLAEQPGCPSAGLSEQKKFIGRHDRDFDAFNGEKTKNCEVQRLSAGGLRFSLR